MKPRSFTSSISVTDGTLSEYGNHIVRHLSAMNRQYVDGQAYAATAIGLHLCNKPGAGNRLRRFVTIVRRDGSTGLSQMFECIKKVRVEDGWLYFLHGWTQVIAQVHHQEIAGEQFDRLASIAGEITR
jgi:hypothetical protein